MLQVDSYKETESLLKSQLSSQEDVDDLRRQLSAANDKLLSYQRRQEAMEKTLKQQLAKTHVVLKKTKASFQTDQNTRPPLRRTGNGQPVAVPAPADEGPLL